MQNRTRLFVSADYDKAFAFMIGAILIGVLLGTVSFCFLSNDLSDMLLRAGERHIDFRRSSDMGHILLDSFFVSSLFITAVFILGFFALGQLPALLILVYRGMGLGMVLSQVYTSYPAGSAAAAALILIPAAVVSCTALCMAAKESVRFSSRLLTIVLCSDPCSGIVSMTKVYGTKYLMFEAAAAASAAVDCIFSVLLSSRI
ncbi:MAG: hypothetical protein IKP95_09735 [Ruminococcus sp.]|nr:hypothetical protein [Ruminococcus sp.]